MTKQPTNHALAAQQIRAKIKAAFPGLKASVRSEAYAGGSSIRVYVNDLCPLDFQKIKEIAKPHQYGHFDGQIDMYEYSNSRDDIAQVRFVFVDNERSDNMLLDIATYIQDERLVEADYHGNLPWMLFNGSRHGFWPIHQLREDQRPAFYYAA